MVGFQTIARVSIEGLGFYQAFLFRVPSFGEDQAAQEVLKWESQLAIKAQVSESFERVRPSDVAIGFSSGQLLQMESYKRQTSQNGRLQEAKPSFLMAGQVDDIFWRTMR